MYSEKSRRQTDTQPGVHEGQQELFESGKYKQEADVSYVIFQGYRTESGIDKSQSDLLENYLRYTDKLIGTIDGSINGTMPFDAVIYLDKSARPVAWMVNELWEDLARVPGTDFDENIIPPKPKTYFLNIDREQWLPTVDPGHTGKFNIDAIPEETLKGLRAIYEPGNDSDNTILDGKRILIVDEVNVTGTTLAISKAILQKAIPDGTFETAHWMNPGVYTNKSGVSTNGDLPVWYKSHDPTGRGVGDRDLNISNNSKSRAQRLGKWFLSTALGFVDQKSVQLRAEIKKMAQEMRDGKILFTPTAERPDKDFVDRITKINSMSEQEFIDKKKARN